MDSNKKLPAPANCQQHLFIGSAETFKERLEQSVLPERPKAEDVTASIREPGGYVIIGHFEKSEFILIRALPSSSPLSASIIRGEIITPPSGENVVKISFEPNQHVNRVVFTAKAIATTFLGMMFFGDLLFPMLGIPKFYDHPWVLAVSICLYTFSGLTIIFMRTKFPPDQILVEHVRKIAAECKAEEDKLRISEKND